MFIAKLETRNFSFLAAGSNAQDAEETMTAGLRRHDMTFGGAELSSETDFNTMEIKSGQVFRDYTLIHGALDVPFLGDGYNKLSTLLGRSHIESDDDLGVVETAIVEKANDIDEGFMMRLAEAGLESDAKTIKELIELCRAGKIAEAGHE
jgi:hypothetical protein